MSHDSVNLEILRMAKELVLNDYTDRRAEMHNKWLVESEHLWRTQKLRLAYPTIPCPPSEVDILEVARKLMTFLTNREDPLANEDLPVLEEIVLADDLPELEEVVPLPDTALQPETELTVEPVAQSKVLPRVLQRLEEMKRSLF
jgi:hypothetical protein